MTMLKGEHWCKTKLCKHKVKPKILTPDAVFPQDGYIPNMKKDSLTTKKHILTMEKFIPSTRKEHLNYELKYILAMRKEVRKCKFFINPIQPDVPELTIKPGGGQKCLRPL